jgi:hypothetical protein
MNNLRGKLEKCFLFYRAYRVSRAISDAIVVLIFAAVFILITISEMNIWYKIGLLLFSWYVIYFGAGAFIGTRLWRFLENRLELSAGERVKIEYACEAQTYGKNVEIDFGFDRCIIKIDGEEI